MHTAIYSIVQHNISAILKLVFLSVYLLGIFNLVLFTCVHADWIVVSTVSTCDQIHPSCCQPMTRST